MLERFVSDIAELRENEHDHPTHAVRVRWKRSWGLAPLSVQLRARAADSDLRLFLYPSTAGRDERAEWSCHVEPDVGIDTLEQGVHGSVIGRLEPGRGVRVVVGEFDMLATTPLRPPLRGPRLRA